MIGAGQAFEARPHWRLSEHQPHPRCRGGPAVRHRDVPQQAEPRRARKAQHGCGGPFTKAAQVLSQAGLDGSHRPTVQALDEPPDKAERVLEGEPRIALAELRAARQSDVPGGDAECRSPAGLSGEAARRKDRVEQRQAQRCQHRGGPQVALDPLQDGRQADQLAGCMEVQQFVDKGLRPGDVGEPGAEGHACRVRTDIGGGAALVIGIQRGLSMLSAAALVAADPTAIVPYDRASESDDACFVIDRPADLVSNERA